MKNSKILFLLFFCLISCSKGIRPALDAEDEYQRAMDFYQKKDYKHALDGFQRIIFTYPGSEYADDAQFYLARSYFQTKDYLQAAMEFEFLIKNFAHSPYQEEAALLQAVSYFKRTPSYYRDQTMTRKALELIEDFLKNYPQTRFEKEARQTLLECREKLARKELENGKFYLKIKEYASAEIYFRSVIDNYPEVTCVREAKFWLGESLYRRGRLDEARDIYQEILNGKDQWQKKAQDRLVRFEKK